MTSLGVNYGAYSDEELVRSLKIHLDGLDNLKQSIYRHREAISVKENAVSLRRGEAQAIRAEQQRRTGTPVCQSDGDGDCVWELCPQLRDNEPATSRRSCPLFPWDEAEL